jgi:hypothetical protein
VLITIAAHADRLSGRAYPVLSLVDDFGAGEIGDVTLKSGIALADHYASEALRLFGASQVADELKLAEKLRRWLVHRWREPDVSLPDMYQFSIAAIRTKTAAKRAVDILEDHGWLETLHAPRATGELAIELATRVDGLLVLEELARRFADRLDPDLLRVIGCHDFPCPPLHVVGGSRR